MAEEITVTSVQLAKLLLLSRSRIFQIEKLGYIARLDNDRWPLVASVQGYIRFLRDEDRRSTRSASESRLKDAKVADLEEKAAIRRREYIPYEEVRTAIDFLAATSRSAIVGLSARVTRDRHMRELIERATDEVLALIADRCAEAANALKKDGGAFSPDAEDDAGRLGEEKPDVPAKRRRARAA